MGNKEAIKIPNDVITQAVEMSDATVYVSIPRPDIAKLKKHAGLIGSYSPTAFKLTDCPTPQEDGSVLKVTVPLVLRTMNNKVPKDANKVVENNAI